MKPSWDDAPEWAEWLAQDGTGDWYWFELKPSLHEDDLWWCDFGRSKFAGRFTAELPLEHRPK